VCVRARGGTRVELLRWRGRRLLASNRVVHDSDGVSWVPPPARATGDRRDREQGEGDWGGWQLVDGWGARMRKRGRRSPHGIDSH
jgi:hypothetical protein